MRAATKEKLLIGGGIAGGVLLLVGAAMVLSPSSSGVDKKPEGVTPIQDTEVRATVAQLLQYEGSPATLRLIASKLRNAGYGNLASSLEDRAKQLGG